MHYQISRGSHSGKILQLNEGLLVPKHFTWPVHGKIYIICLILPANYFWPNDNGFEN